MRENIHLLLRSFHRRYKSLACEKYDLSKLCYLPIALKTLYPNTRCTIVKEAEVYASLMTHVSYAPYIEKYRSQCQGQRMVWPHYALRRMARVVIKVEVVSQQDSNISNSLNYLLRKVWYFGFCSVVRNFFQSFSYQWIQENEKYSKNCDQQLMYSRSKFYAHQSINKFWVLTSFTIPNFPLSKTNVLYWI